MGKKRIVKKSDSDKEVSKSNSSSISKRHLENGIFYVNSTYNNTLVSLTDPKGNIICASSSGALGFSGTKKGTPFAAAKAGELIGSKAQLMGMKEALVIVKGIGAGRESAIRSFAGKGINISEIRDITPVAFNGPKPKKPRRV
ncbi:MAG: 30S ribosomal protein S11 [Candidatus Paceibacterota bacterium]